MSTPARDSIEPIIYHYTSTDGLIGILGHGRLWATHIRHFEDESELLYAEKIHDQVLDEIKREYPPTSFQNRLADACRLEQRPLPDRSSPLSKGSSKPTPWLNKVLDIYVTCFSTRGDIAYQWGKYARGGEGFAIGFKRRELKKVIQPRADKWEATHLDEVRYSVDAQKRELRSIFEKHCSHSSSSIARNAGEIVKALALHASRFKHPDFEREKELRIIIETLGGRDDVLFRSSSGKLIPYIETAKQKNGRLPVDSIIIGRALDYKASERAVQSLLDARGYRGVKIAPAPLTPSTP